MIVTALARELGRFLRENAVWIAVIILIIWFLLSLRRKDEPDDDEGGVAP